MGIQSTRHQGDRRRKITTSVEWKGSPDLIWFKSTRTYEYNPIYKYNQLSMSNLYNLLSSLKQKGDK